MTREQRLRDEGAAEELAEFRTYLERRGRREFSEFVTIDSVIQWVLRRQLKRAQAGRPS